MIPAVDDYDPEGLAALPGQFPPQSGCRALLTALLEDLFYCKAKRRASKRAWRQYVSDVLWVASASTAPFSFVWVCRELDLDPAGVRARFLAQELVGKQFGIT